MARKRRERKGPLSVDVGYVMKACYGPEWYKLREPHRSIALKTVEDAPVAVFKRRRGGKYHGYAR